MPCLAAYSINVIDVIPSTFVFKQTNKHAWSQ